jgi:4-hydroxythreonine-4-phosphate dehydrogenase
MSQRLPVAISMGDPRGIGPTLIAHLFYTHAHEMHGCMVVGELSWMRAANLWVARQLGRLPLPLHCIDSPPDVLIDTSGILLLNIEQQSERGCRRFLDFSQENAPRGMLENLDAALRATSHEAAGRTAANAVRVAAQQVLNGQAAALVTAPLNKEALAAAGEPFLGHTELLQSLAAEHAGASIADMPVRMMLANDELRVVLDSIHVPLAQAVRDLNTARLLQTLQIAHQHLSQSLGRAPRLAVAGLNPHAGEGGLLGREEIELIAPAIAQAHAAGIQASGPFPPDTVFAKARGFEHFDAVIALYHDQGLIPIKYMGLDEGVNHTLGLPIVRTSPDHGTAFDIAWKQLARPDSLLNAIRAVRKN